ncbi:MAG: hypothetical protein VX038_02225 [Verrucomicrobiota bacterium]|nr:hypothetical protein [Verrucomicrobiota bacterium]
MMKSKLSKLLLFSLFLIPSFLLANRVPTVATSALTGAVTNDIDASWRKGVTSGYDLVFQV